MRVWSTVIQRDLWTYERAHGGKSAKHNVLTQLFQRRRTDDGIHRDGSDGHDFLRRNNLRLFNIQTREAT
jgi:hypothetical protein